MKSAFYSGASGLVAFQQALDVTGNNLANVNTAGYKVPTQSFDDLMYTQMWCNAEAEPQTGHGVRTVGLGTQMEQSAMAESTGNGYNYAIAGNTFGMFALEDGEGNIFYTRNGAFTVDAEEEELVTADGLYVLDSSGSHITATGTSGANEDGPLENQIGVYTFLNPSALTAVNGSKFTENEQSGEGEALDPEEGTYQVLHGYLEQSGVSLQDEMTNLIIAQRAYQMNARVVQTADEMEQLISALRS